jgi:hypothetical protein
MVAKVICKGQTRRVVLEYPYSLDLLISILATRLGLSKGQVSRASLECEDVDSEWTCLNSDDDLRDAVARKAASSIQGKGEIDKSEIMYSLEEEPLILRMQLLIPEKQQITDSLETTVSEQLDAPKSRQRDTRGFEVGEGADGFRYEDDSTSHHSFGRDFAQLSYPSLLFSAEDYAHTSTDSKPLTPAEKFPGPVQGDQDFMHELQAEDKDQTSLQRHGEWWQGEQYTDEEGWRAALRFQEEEDHRQSARIRQQEEEDEALARSLAELSPLEDTDYAKNDPLSTDLRDEGGNAKGKQHPPGKPSLRPDMEVLDTERLPRPRSVEEEGTKDEEARLWREAAAAVERRRRERELRQQEEEDAALARRLQAEFAAQDED